MSDSTIGSTGGAQGIQLNETNETKRPELSLADLMLQTMLDRAATLDDQIRTQANVVKTQNDQIKKLNQLYAKLDNKASQIKDLEKTTTQESTWIVNDDTTPKEILLDDGKKLVFEGKDQAWSIVDAEGNSTRFSGNLTIKESDNEHNTWSLRGDTSTFILDDGTKITLKTKDPNSLRGDHQYNRFSDSLVITKGNQSIQVTGISKNSPSIGKPEFGGARLDGQTNDGNIFRMGDDVDDWVYEGSEVKTGANVWWETSQFGKSSAQNEVKVDLKRENSEISYDLLSKEDRQLIKDLGITIYDKSETGHLDYDEIKNLMIQIKDSRDSVSSLSNIDLTKLDSYNKKYTQSLDLASTFMKSQYEQAKSLIRNIN